jgi:hypothetical protein
MPYLKQSDPAVLATAVADCLVVASDPNAKAAGIYFWNAVRPYRDAVVDAVRNCPDEVVRSLGENLLASPEDPAAHAALCLALAQRRDHGAIDTIMSLAWRTECNSRVGYHLGGRHERTSAPVTAQELRGLPAGDPLPPGAEPEVLVVIPFRDRSLGGGDRLRNLLACLLALRDQSYPRDGYQVTVVESDDEPRWQEVIAPLADHYLFAPNAGTWNKSWAINVGVMHTPGPTEVVCIHDADVLADRDFVARHAERFTRPGVMGFLPYRDMLQMDDVSTWDAIRGRLAGRAAAADLSRVRGFTLHRGPGLCTWVRAEMFLRVGGMDERYQGWGGEDFDFINRFGFAAPFDCYDEPLLHMRHPSNYELRKDGELVNAHIPPLSWPPDSLIGQLDRFAAPRSEQSLVGHG